ncbi:MAG: class I SAM-dependent methyltransferase [Azospirillaceae bacterium]
MPRLRATLRRLGMGLSTVLGLRARGFFIPYRYADRIRRPQPAYAAIESLFARQAAVMTAVLDQIDDHADDLAAIAADAEPPEPRWRQGWFCRLDAAAAYVMVRRSRPARIVEIGSGHSTRFLARALRDGVLATAFTCIDPAPLAEIAGIGVDVHADVVQTAPPGLFGALGPGDILFVDSSHLAQPGSDVDWLAGRVLPRLARGVLVHIHDILLPDDYPPAWFWRGYNEQTVAAALMAGGGFRPLFSSHYAVTRLAGRVAEGAAAGLPLVEGGLETSLWLEKTVDPVG